MARIPTSRRHHSTGVAAIGNNESRPMRIVPLALLLALAVPTAEAQEATPPPEPRASLLQRSSQAAQLGRIEATRHLPGGGFMAVEVAGRDGLYFLSVDGRILIKGSAYDLWSGRTLATLADVERAATRLDLAGLTALWPQLDPFELGDGPTTVVAFVAPGCPHCRSLIEEARGLADRYRFLFLPIPAGGQSAAVVRSLACARDRGAAEAAFLRHEAHAGLEQLPSCNLEPLQRRVITAQLLGVQGVPWLVRGDGTLSQGLPQDLAAWLAAGSAS